MTRIYLTGSGSFGAAVANNLTEDGYEIVGVAAPVEGRRGGHDPLASWAHGTGTPYAPATELRAESVPDGTDLLVAAHSHAFVGRKTRARARYAVGYHPSLLPLHRGRDAVRWQARNRDRVIGGTVYHLTDRVDGGPIAYQGYQVIAPGLTASELWRKYLAPLGISLINQAAFDLLGGGSLPWVPQDDEAATWEPALDAEPLYRPELLELTP